MRFHCFESRPRDNRISHVKDHSEESIGRSQTAPKKNGVTKNVLGDKLGDKAT